MKGIVEVPGGGRPAIDSLLGSELKALELADATLAVRRCNEKAEEPVGGPGAADFAAEKDKMPQHLLRAYYLLRFLKTRASRWQLLSVFPASLKTPEWAPWVGSFSGVKGGDRTYTL
eukprot:g16417.t1